MTSYNPPPEMARLAIETGVAKATNRPEKVFVAAILAGAYIAFGALLAIGASAGWPLPTPDHPANFGGLQTLVTGVTFSLGLVLVVIGGADLLTGNMMTVPMAVFAGRISPVKLVVNWVIVTVGNLIGSLLVAWLFVSQTGLFKTDSPDFTRLATIATGKAITETHWEQFVRAIGCNWLVCLAVLLAMASPTVTGKILAIVFPITAFVALGFDHVVANMFFLPAAMMVHAGGLTTTDTVMNLVMAFLGNVVGGALFVGGAYVFLFNAKKPHLAAAGNGVVARGEDATATV